MKHLIIPDVHGKRFWTLEQLERFIKSQFGMIVCLGDFFDSFDKTVDEQIELFEELCTLKEKYPKNVIMLWGNHDGHYSTKFNPNLKPLCSGFQEKYKFRISNLIEKHFNKFQFAYQYKNYLFTHAGLSNTYLEYLKDKTGLEDIVEMLNYPHQEHNWASNHNGGSNKFDGIMWIRPTQLEKDLPKLDIIQVVGHTYQEYGVNITKDVIYCDAHQLITLDI